MIIDKEAFIFNNDTVFSQAFYGFIGAVLHKGNDFFGMRVATAHSALDYMKKPTQKRKQELIGELRAEDLDNFQVIEVLDFVEYYRYKRKKYATKL